MAITEVDVHEAYKEVFSSAAGRIVLADLVRHFGFTTRSTIVPGDRQRSDANEGQRTVLLHIERTLITDPRDHDMKEPEYDGTTPEPHFDRDDDLGGTD